MREKADPAHEMVVILYFRHSRSRMPGGVHAHHVGLEVWLWHPRRKAVLPAVAVENGVGIAGVNCCTTGQLEARGRPD